jgi:hypothetical protein
VEVGRDLGREQREAYEAAAAALSKNLSEMFEGMFPSLAETSHSFDGLVAILNGCWQRESHGPPPLCIDGREYHRRQRRRKGKR